MEGGNIVVLKDIIDYYTQNILQKTSRRRDEPDNVPTRVNWDLLKIQQKDTTFGNFEKTPKPSETVLYETEIEAAAGNSTTVKLNVKRNSSSKAVFNVKQGLVGGTEIEFPFPPQHADVEDVLRGRAGFNKLFKLDHSKTNEFENDMEWSVEATVEVPEGQTTLFTVMLQEMTVEADFYAEVHVSGRLHSVATEMVKSFEPKSIVEIVRVLKSSHGLPEHLLRMLELVEVEKSKIVVPVVGHCNFKYGVNTKVSSKAI